MLTISVGESRHSTNWIPKEVTWEKLVKKLRNPKITSETMAAYAAMSKDQRGNIKDVGGFVGGRINGGKRKAGAISDRQLVCLDADFADSSIFDTWAMMVGKACVMHSSHSHTPENPRFRFIIPLSRPVTAEEYEPIARRLAEWIDINAFDDTTYEASRLMYWPSCSSDAEYIFRECESQEWVDPDEVLATYEDWHDMRHWPTSNRQQEVVVRQHKLQGDPLTKPGTIGAFNRTYSITAAIEKYLPGVYEQVAPDRWTYTAGTTTGGAVTYDNDTFIFSHHDTDPISGKLCNAFDMVRIHLFGELDEDSTDDISSLPSTKAMREMLRTDPEVSAALALANRADPADAFNDHVDLLRMKGDFTEQGLAVLFTDNYGLNLRHSKAFGWMYWDDSRWLLDADPEASMLMLKYTDDAYQAARARQQMATEPAEVKAAKAEMTAVSRARTAAGKAHLLSLAETMLHEPNPEKYDANPWILNTPDGIVDLHTGEIGPHNQKAMCTKCTRVSPGLEGADRWKAFIDGITGGDESFANYLQQLAGMSAIGAVYEEGLVISYGPGGNGKSTLFGAISRVLGDYAKTTNADLLVSNGRNTDQTFVMSLRGARLVIMSETEEGAYLSISQLKRLTSQDVIAARSLYKDPIEFTPSHTTIMHTNHLPRLGSLDGGVRRRIAVAPFPRTIQPDEMIKGYQDILVNECGPAILRWIIEGAVMFDKNNRSLDIPPVVKEATEKYLAGEDWLQLFLDECCEMKGECASNELYQAYQLWSNTQGRRPKSIRDFGEALEIKGFTRRKTISVRVWEGLSLKASGI